MRLTHFILGLLLAFATILAGCNTQQEASSSPKNSEDATSTNGGEHLKIYTTLYPLEYFTKRIGGDDVVVESIIPAGADAHTYEPTSKQMINIAEADAFIYNGLGMESYAKKIAEALKEEKTVIVEAAHGVDAISHSHDEHETDTHDGDEHEHIEKSAEHQSPADHDSTEHAVEDHTDEHSEEQVDEHGHHHGDLDPHVWLDPYRSITLAENIKNSLVELKPDAKEQFENNFNALVSDLKNLDAEFHQLVETKNNPKIIVSHAGYGYWEESYGIRQIAVSGLSPTNEPSQQDLEEIINTAKKEQINYIIYEQNITPKVADVVRKEIKAEPLRLHNLAVLTDEDIKNGEDYFSLMRKNIETLKIALQ